MNIKSILAAIACLSLLSFAQLPALRIATKNNQTPVANSGNGFCPTPSTGTSGMMSYTEPYIEATETELSGADSKYNFSRKSSGIANESDSIRRRGNSTATASKLSFRVKFDKKVAMLGRPAEKSWALLANYYDPSVMQSNIAFYLGRKLGLQFTPNGYYVKLNLANQDRGVYLLTDQIQRSEASVNIDKEGGWLAEFDYHCATSAADKKRFYYTGDSRYNINAKIREPDLDDLPLNSSKQPDTTCLDFVKSDLNALLDKMKEGNFPNNGYRDYIDLESYAKYIMIQLFMDNQDWNGLASNSTMLGSTYAFRNKGEKIKAGPLWDFDLACGSKLNMGGGFGGGGSGGGFFQSDINEQLEPRHDFYKRIFQDPVFQAKYKKIWNDNKSVFESINKSGGVIDSITNLVAGSITGNVANGVSNVTEDSYRTHTGNLKTWWGKRITAFESKVNSMSGSDVAESAVATAFLNSKMTCKEAVSSSSKPAASSSSANNVASSSSANNVVSSSSSLNNGQITLSCTGLQSSVAKGGTIAIPTLTCSNGVAATDTVWNGRGSTGWAVRPETQTQSYNISVTATCGSQRNLQAQCGTVAVGAPPSSSSEGPTPIVSKQTTLANIHAQAIGNAIVLENLPSNTRIELYSLQGKRIYSGNSGNSQILRIPVQAKGMYIIRIKQGNSTSTYQNRIYLN